MPSSLPMFIASKLLSFATQPLAWVLLLLMGGMLGISLRRKWGRTLTWTALLVLVIQGWQPLPDALLRHLEAQYPEVPDAQLRQFVGVVVLGGALEPSYVWQGHRQFALNDAAERMIMPLALLQQNPTFRLLFTGGDGELFTDGMTEAERAKIFFDRMGVPPQRVLYEDASHTTYENAIFGAKVAGVNPAKPWLLLTSASHMPRAMATFRQAGWNVTAYPVDFKTGTQTPLTQYSLEISARKWHLALHELLGLLIYRLAGRA